MRTLYAILTAFLLTMPLPVGAWTASAANAVSSAALGETSQDPTPEAVDPLAIARADLVGVLRTLQALERDPRIPASRRALASRARAAVERNLETLGGERTRIPRRRPPPDDPEAPAGRDAPPPSDGSPLELARPQGLGRIPVRSDWPELPRPTNVEFWPKGLESYGTGGLVGNLVEGQGFATNRAPNQKTWVLGVGWSPNGPSVENNLFRDCLFEGSPPPSWSPNGARWLIRGSNVHALGFERCQFLRWDEEHALYLNPYGSVYVTRCLFEDGGAQALQLAWRSWETVYAGLERDPYGDGRRGLQVVEECLVRNVGQTRGAGRASYALSFFSGQNQAGSAPVAFILESEVELLRNRLESDVPAAVGGRPDARSYGAILVVGRRKLTLEDNVVDYLRPNRPVVKVGNVTDGNPDSVDVTWRGGSVREGEVVFANCGRLEIEPGIGGSARLRIFRAPGVSVDLLPGPGEKVGGVVEIHSGPLSAGYSGSGGE